MDSTGGEIDTGAQPDFPADCSVFDQDCPPGWKCAPCSLGGGVGWDGGCCVPVAEDPAEVGDPCTILGGGFDGLDDCELGAMCWYGDRETSMGTCLALCIGSENEPECADLCAQCLFVGDSLALCLVGCDPLMPQCELEGQGCYPMQDRFVCMPSIAPRGAGVGSPCTAPVECPIGHACVEADRVAGCPRGSAGCCTALCAPGPGGSRACDGLLPGSDCVLWYEDPADGPPERCIEGPIGACLSP